MANRNSKLIERILKDFSLNISTNGEGGTKVVTELPEVGDEHTIYELQTISPSSYAWILGGPIGVKDYSHFSDYTQFLVFDTYDQMYSTINSIPITENTLDAEYFAYIRNTKQMYYFAIMFPETGDPYWIFEEQQKKEDESGTDYAFQLEGQPDYRPFYILKEVGGNFQAIPDGGHNCSFITLDDKEVFLGQDGCGLMLKKVELPIIAIMGGFIGDLIDFSVDHLLTAEELESGIYKKHLDANDGIVFIFNTTDKKFYSLQPSSSDYYYYWDELSLEGYLASTGEYDGKPPHYNGPLVWNIDSPEEFGATTFDEIPYEKLINELRSEAEEEWPYWWIFEPADGQKITSTYWIYTNGEWVNVDNIPVPSTSLGVVYTNIRTSEPNVNNAVDIYYGEEKLEINDYYVQKEETEIAVSYYAYATVSGLPLLNSETHQFTLKICPKIIVDTENDRLSISVNGRNVYKSQWKQEIPSEISVIVEGISQIEINVNQMEA